MERLEQINPVFFILYGKNSFNIRVLLHASSVVERIKFVCRGSTVSAKVTK